MKRKGLLLLYIVLTFGWANAQVDSVQKPFFFSQYKFSYNQNVRNGWGLHSEFGCALGRMMPSIGLGYEANYFTKPGKPFADDTLFMVQQVPLYITNRTAVFRDLIYLITSAGITKTISDEKAYSGTGVLLFAGLGANGITSTAFMLEVGAKVLSIYDGVNNKRYTGVYPSISLGIRIK